MSSLSRCLKTWLFPVVTGLVASGLTLLLPAVIGTPAFAEEGVIIDARFDSGPDGFVYANDIFRNTLQPRYASGTHAPTRGFRGGALQVALGGLDNVTVRNISGGWQYQFTLAEPTRAILTFRYNLIQSPNYESDEVSQVLVSIDGALRGTAPRDYVAQVVGNGDGGSLKTTGWRLFQVDLDTLGAGDHTLALGGFNGKKNSSNESTEVLIDDVRLVNPEVATQVVVGRLDFERFKLNIRSLANFGDRTQGTQRNIDANSWIQAELEAMGYEVQRHAYTFNGLPRNQLYATKVGSVYPDQMYMITAHMDGRGGGEAADDDASGCSLVLEAARVLGGADVQTDVSVRFIFWNNEETGLNGSAAYMQSRSPLRGIETSKLLPDGSVIPVFSEPRWLGIVQHDMIMFDHGLPPQAAQIAAADIDVEYQAASTFAGPAQTLANALRGAAARYSQVEADTPRAAQVSNDMDNTDSKSFWNVAPAVSVRENQRNAEIGFGANPNWHQKSDMYDTYSEADFLLGFNAVQMTTGAVAELAGVRVIPVEIVPVPDPDPIADPDPVADPIPDPVPDAVPVVE
jgi:Peptidase family M28